MNVLRLILVCLLSLSIPTTALASVVLQSQCEQRHAVADTLSIHPSHGTHIGERPYGDHTQHMTHSGDSPPTDLEQCGHCNTGHCASTCASTLASNDILPADSLTVDAELATTLDSRTAVAHSFDLLRPPSLT
jgi:hypothetical protein